MLEQAQALGLSGSVMQLGRQRMYFSRNDIEAWARKANVQISAPVGVEGKPSVDPNAIMTDVEFFNAIGFEDVYSGDISDYQESSHGFDLNLPLPEDLKGKYDVVFDGGTIEHIFDQPSVFRNIHDLLKPDGRIIHFSPSTNNVDHGFYMYSPTLFYEYYSANQYDIEVSQIYKFKATAPVKVGTWDFYEYTPGSLGWLTNSFPGPMGVFMIAKKNEHSLRGVIPQQGRMANAWMGSTQGEVSKLEYDEDDEIASHGNSYHEAVTTRPSRARTGFIAATRDFVKRNPFLYRSALWVRRRVPWGKMPKKVGTY